LSPVEARAQTAPTFEAFWNSDRPALWAVYNHEMSGPRGPIRIRIRDTALYEPRPIDTSAIELSADLRELAERLAENAHDNWARRLSEG
jgi:RyR domain